jgi:hypothetical protein
MGYVWLVIDIFKLLYVAYVNLRGYTPCLW